MTAGFTVVALGRRILPDTYGLALLGLLLIVAGVLFACWARHILGSNWSSEVQLKQDHELIERGPYRYVRHPIYTGILLALLGTVVLLGEWRALVGFVIMFVSFWRKLRLEEAWLSEHFGPAYGEYLASGVRKALDINLALRSYIKTHSPR